MKIACLLILCAQIVFAAEISKKNSALGTSETSLAVKPKNSPAAVHEIALTFDDAPLPNGLVYTGVQRTERIIAILKKYNIQAAFFSNTKLLPVDSGTQRLKDYAKAGHFIGNHTHAHADLHTTEMQSYLKEIDQADQLIKEYSTYRKWFRYPFLHEGTTIKMRDDVRNHLKKLKYINAYITVENYDYFIDDLIQQALAKKQKVNMGNACEMMNDLMMASLKYYDKVARKNIGPVRQVLLMHEDDTEAYCLEKLILRLKENNWSIISPELAYSDPLLKEDPDTLFLGVGRVAAYMHAKKGVHRTGPAESVSTLTENFKKRKIVQEK